MLAPPATVVDSRDLVEDTTIDVDAEGTVIGDIEVPIEVEAVVTECVPVSNIDNRCAGGPDNSVRTTKQVRAQLRVRADR